MVKSNELREGNWVLEAGEPSIVYHIERGGTSMYRINDIPYNRQTECTINGGDDRIAPIPLTPEILEKAGFEWRKSIHRWTKEWFKIIESDLGFKNGIGDGSFKQPDIKYLHQLQNLYFALTGKELTINFKDLTYQ